MHFSADLGPEAVKGLNITAAISPDGMRLAFVARGGEKPRLAARPLDQVTATTLLGTENATDPSSRRTGSGLGRPARESEQHAHCL
jgi:hypothetical protein